LALTVHQSSGADSLRLSAAAEVSGNEHEPQIFQTFESHFHLTESKSSRVSTSYYISSFYYSSSIFDT
jgi:hypothetical protein